MDEPTGDEMEIFLDGQERFPEDVEDPGEGTSLQNDEGNAERKSLSAHRSDQSPQGAVIITRWDSDEDEEDSEPVFSGPGLKRHRWSKKRGKKEEGREDYARMASEDFWLLHERALRLTDIDGETFPSLLMPKMTIATIKTVLQSSLAYDKRRAFFIFGPEPINSSGREVIQEFLKIVKSTRLISINTEGNKYPHPTRKEESGEPAPLVILVVANLSGTILCFPDSVSLPIELREVIEDVAIYKVGSGLCREAEELARIGVRFRGWAETGALYRAFLKKEEKTSLEVQCKFLNDFEPSQDRFPYFKYSWKWDRGLKKGLAKFWPYECYPHVSMNVRAPLGVVCAVAVKFALDQKLPDDTFAFPIIFEALDLVRAKAGVDLQDLSSDVRQNWVAKPPESSSFRRHERLQNCRELTFIRKGQADFVEVLEDFYNRGIVASNAYRLYLDPEGSRLPFPTRSICVASLTGKFFRWACSACGSPNHRWRACPEGKAGEPLECSYPHDGVTDLKPHTIRTCPALHHYCSLCFMRGHFPQVHRAGTYTQRQLRERFLLNQPKGLLTSILLLSTRPQGQGDFIAPCWRFGLLSLSFQRDAISRHHLRVPPTVRLGPDRKRADPGEEDRRAALIRKIEDARRRAERFAPVEFRHQTPTEIKAPKVKNPDHPVWKRLGRGPTGEKGAPVPRSFESAREKSAPAHISRTSGEKVAPGQDDLQGHDQDVEVRPPPEPESDLGSDYADAYIIEETVDESEEESYWVAGGRTHLE